MHCTVLLSADAEPIWNHYSENAATGYFVVVKYLLAYTEVQRRRQGSMDISDHAWIDTLLTNGFFSIDVISEFPEDE